MGTNRPVVTIRKSMTVTEAADRGSTRDMLVATRDRLAVSIDDPKTLARDLAALTRRLIETTKEIEAIDAREGEELEENEVPMDSPFDISMI
jgi:hypothetical protein